MKTETKVGLFCIAFLAALLSYVNHDLLFNVASLQNFAEKPQVKMSQNKSPSTVYVLLEEKYPPLGSLEKVPFESVKQVELSVWQQILLLISLLAYAFALALAIIGTLRYLINGDPKVLIRPPGYQPKQNTQTEKE